MRTDQMRPDIASAPPGTLLQGLSPSGIGENANADLLVLWDSHPTKTNPTNPLSHGHMEHACKMTTPTWCRRKNVSGRTVTDEGQADHHPRWHCWSPQPWAL